MKLIIAGGRDFDCKDPVCKEVGKSGGITEIVSGTARGEDRLGEEYAKEKGIKVRRFPADWNKHGKAAGPIRNEEMAQYADSLIAFWDGASRGTGGMIELARKYGLEVTVVKYSLEKIQ